MHTDMPQESNKRDNLFAIAVGVSLTALLVAVVGFGFGMRAIDKSEEKSVAGGTSGASGGPSSASVSLKEFSIDDASVAVGGMLQIKNAGSVPHNLIIDGTDVKTGDLGSGDSEALMLGGVAPGTYTVYCNIPGHRDAGMEAQLTVGGDGPVAGGTDHSEEHMDYQAMTDAMLSTMSKFPTVTEGVGNPTLEPTEVLADGTKVFDLVAAITPWEVSPGKIVQAWSYNGVVPGPSIYLEIGDKVEFRMKNDLPLATDMHLHGLNMDFEFDGVAPITQPVVNPGETFVYKYTADEVAVAMYHPHFHSQVSMPNGMFGTIFVGQVPLPLGKTVGGVDVPADVKITQEFPMVVNDSGVIGYSLNGKSFPATAPIFANDGDWVLFHYFNEGSQSHPMHLHRFDQIVVAKDGFPLDNPYLADVVNVAPGERYSVLVHLDKPGTWIWHCHILPHVESDTGMFGMVTAIVVK
ncbi:MAG TPA: multicopper oxidase domain-containing protein [Ilumatobacteraceae bacterium]|nr:multicopper oxidase domain-containing protein [Ilumatobacteraceae bacterium]